jgi:hypothetical protein
MDVLSRNTRTPYVRRSVQEIRPWLRICLYYELIDHILCRRHLIIPMRTPQSYLLPGKGREGPRLGLLERNRGARDRDSCNGLPASNTRQGKVDCCNHKSSEGSKFEEVSMPFVRTIKTSFMNMDRWAIVLLRTLHRIFHAPLRRTSLSRVTRLVLLTLFSGSSPGNYTCGMWNVP